MNREQILAWLLEENPDRLETLWSLADKTRSKHVGGAVHTRGLIEFSNFCRSNCHYCGLRSGRRSVVRYRMSRTEMVAAAREAAGRGYGTVVMQSGEDPGLDVDWLAGVIEQIKAETPLAVTLGLGERGLDELAHLRDAGADRYYLRFETSDRALWERIHPGKPGHRLDLLPRIKDLGYETGSGIIVGIPGQSWESVAEDIEWFRRLDLDMIGCGPYVAHPDTPSGQEYSAEAASGAARAQAPNTNLATLKVVALTRLVCPDVNIPSTTALATLDGEDGYRLGLSRGANVLMVNLTPLEYRGLYEIYPAKAGIAEAPEAQRERVENLLAGISRAGGEGPGASLHFEARRRAASSTGR